MKFPDLRTYVATQLTITFLAMISVPLVLSILGIGVGTPLDEKRKLAANPELRADWTVINEFPRQYEAYFNDHFCLRNPLIFCNSYVRVHGLATSVTSSVVRGKQGWLFFNGDQIMDNFRGIIPMADCEMSDWQKYLEGQHAWLKERGITYCFVAAPEKQSIYPEYLQDNIRRAKSITRLDQLTAYLHEHSYPDEYFLDLRPVLLDAKKQERVFHCTDTHWNDLGAYAAYRAAMVRLGRIDCMHRWNAVPRDAFKVVSQRVHGMDLAGMLGLSECFFEDHLELVPRTSVPVSVEPCNVRFGRQWAPNHLSILTRAEGQGTIVVYGDSFTTALLPLFSRHAKRTVLVHAGLLGGELLRQIVAAEQPFLVLEGHVERQYQHKCATESTPIDPEWLQARARFQRTSPAVVAQRDRASTAR